jgi:colanic acid biosynthesis glycosyl transferase WcaI
MPHKGHILVINRVFPPDSGASGLRLMELCQGLAAKNWRITVLTNKGRNIEPEQLNDNITLLRLPFGSVDGKPSGWQYAFWIFALFLRAVSLPPSDVTITLTDPPMSVLITAFLKKVKKTKTIYWIHDLYPNIYPMTGVRMPIMQPILNFLAGWAMRKQDAVVALGEDMKSIILPTVKDPSKVKVIPNWPDVQVSTTDKKKPAHHDSHNPFLLEGVFTVLYSGNFGLVHDFDPIIDAIKIVHQSPHPIRFIFAGDGPKFTEVRDKIEQMVLTNVHFIRAQPKEKFMDMLLAGDLHIATLIPEAAGMVSPSKINSALGLARPCIYLSSPKCSQAKLIKDFDAGVVVDPVDPHAKFLIAEAVINYATHHDSYERASKNALQAADSISFDKALNAFDALCRQLHTEA